MKHLINLVLLLSLLSCNTAKEATDDTKRLKDFLKEVGYESIFKHSTYYFLPINNCSSCDDDYKKFINENHDKEAVQIIICSTNARKIKLIVGKTIRQNLIIDKKHLATMKYDLLNNSIMVYQVSDKKVSNKYEVKTNELTNQLIQ